VSERREIKLANGNVLTVDVRPGFYERVRASFGLPPTAPVQDDQVRTFLFNELRSAIDNAPAVAERVQAPTPGASLQVTDLRLSAEAKRRLELDKDALTNVVRDGSGNGR